MTDNKNETNYYDPITGEPVTAKYLVTLVVPANHLGQIEIEAKSEQDASRMALEKVYEIDWELPRLRLHESEIEVLDVECLEEADGALLSRPSDGSSGDGAGDVDNVAPVPTQGTDGHQ